MDNFHRKAETTADGSVTFYIPEIDEHYHSTNGAITEAELVYINNAFIHRNKKDIHLLEIGFGTGLNAFLTFIKARKENIKVHYTTIELYPLSEDKISMLNYPQLISPEDLEFFIKMHTCEWGKSVNISDNFVI